MNIFKSVLVKARNEYPALAEGLLAKKELSKLEQIRLASVMVAIVRSHSRSTTSEISYFDTTITYDQTFFAQYQLSKAFADSKE